MENHKDKAYLPELDGVCFFALLLVMIHHVSAILKHPIWLSLYIYGSMAVDLFLYLSAFLIMKLLYTEYERTGSDNIGYFYVRRALCIWSLLLTFAISSFSCLFLETHLLQPKADLLLYNLGLHRTSQDQSFHSNQGYRI